MQHPAMAITRLADCSVLTVTGPIPESAVEPFSRAVRQTAEFSGLPSVVDLREAGYIHPGALGALVELSRGPHPKVAELEVLVCVSTVQDFTRTMEP